MSQAGPGPGFGFLDLEHPMVVRAAELHVHRLAAVAVAAARLGMLIIGAPSIVTAIVLPLTVTLITWGAFQSKLAGIVNRASGTVSSKSLWTSLTISPG